MKLENQVCAVEQAKIIDELGVKAESCFVWVYYDYDRDGKEWALFELADAKFDLEKGIIKEYFHAYSCAELGVMLPEEIEKKFPKPYCSQILYLNIIKQIIDQINVIFGFVCGYVWSDWDGSDDMDIQKKAKHEAHAKADLLIHLLEQKIIKPEDVKL